MNGYAVSITTLKVTEYRSNTPYCADWHRKFVNGFNQIAHLTNTDEVPDVVSTLNIPTNTSCFVVWAEYSEGNSMGKSVGQYEVFGVFPEQEMANELSNALEKHNKDLPFTFKKHGCVIDNMILPWEDYHAKLMTVHVTGTLMQ